MTTNENPPAGGDGGSGGTGEKPTTVSREAYDALLSEKKAEAEKRRAEQARREELEREKKEREDNELKKRNEHETLLKQRDEELKTERTKREALEAERVEARKFHAFQKTLGQGVDPKFAALVDLDRISVDSDGKIDEASVAKYVDEYKKTYPETFGRGAGPGVPQTKPHGGGGSLSYDEWKALPLSERKARLSEVVKG